MLEFEAIDSDGNKLIDEKEAQNHLEARSYFNTTRKNHTKFSRQEWNQMDVNRDGKISPKEFDNSLKDSDTKIMRVMDKMYERVEALDERIGDLESIN